VVLALSSKMLMLTEQEFERVTSLRVEGVRASDSLGPVVAEYERITGLRETNPNAIYHHRLSLYGPPCQFCGKPLRTRKRSFAEAV
jgi:hypothetical protein